ncbi:MAG: hypothetical protein ACR2N6_02325 [Miltoncostaeaceae bacterium]
MGSRYGTEIAFRLGPGNDERARSRAQQLARAAVGAIGHTLFLNDAGEYGCLAEWETEQGARGYGDRPEVAAVLADLEAELGKRPSLRVYRMERQTPGPPA